MSVATSLAAFRDCRGLSQMPCFLTLAKISLDFAVFAGRAEVLGGKTEYTELKSFIV